MTLTETASLTKKGLLIFSILGVVGISAWFSFQYYYHNYYLKNLPKVEEKPTAKWGALPQPLFPKTTVPSSNLSYTLNTETGSPPGPDKIPNLIKVYFIPQLEVGVLAPERTRGVAEKFGFTGEPIPLTPTQYLFTDDKGGEITVNLDTGNLDFKRPLASESALLDNLPDQTQIVQQFKQFLNSKNLLNDELSDGRSAVVYAGNPQESSSAAVTLWQVDIDNLPIVTPNFKQGLVNGNITKAEELNQKFNKLEYIFWRPDKENVQTYPLKTGEQAFNDLKAGKGILLSKPAGQNISITSIYLAYFEPKEYAPYLQPIYVFEGEGGFVAYVAGITDDYLQK